MVQNPSKSVYPNFANEYWEKLYAVTHAAGSCIKYETCGGKDY